MFTLATPSETVIEFTETPVSDLTPWSLKDFSSEALISSSSLGTSLSINSTIVTSDP